MNTVENEYPRPVSCIFLGTGGSGTADYHNLQLIISRSTPNSVFNFPGEGVYCLFVGFDKRGREEL
jgi:hypothetical protein